MRASARAHGTSLRIYKHAPLRHFTHTNIPIVFFMCQRPYWRDLAADIDVHFCARAWHKPAHVPSLKKFPPTAVNVNSTEAVAANRFATHSKTNRQRRVNLFTLTLMRETRTRIVEQTFPNVLSHQNDSVLHPSTTSRRQRETQTQPKLSRPIELPCV